MKGGGASPSPLSNDVSINPFLASSRVETGIIVHDAQPMFYVSIFLVSGKREGEEKHRESPPSLHYYFLLFQVGCTAMKYSILGSVQPQEIGESL